MIIVGSFMRMAEKSVILNFMHLLEASSCIKKLLLFLFYFATVFLTRAKELFANKTRFYCFLIFSVLAIFVIFYH